MDGIHPKFVLSKRFPVHAAVEQLQLLELERLLTPTSDAKFHFGRKLNNTDISILHQVERVSGYKSGYRREGDSPPEPFQGGGGPPLPEFCSPLSGSGGTVTPPEHLWRKGVCPPNKYRPYLPYS